MFCLVRQYKAKSNSAGGNFAFSEYTLTCRLRESSTRSAWRMRTQRKRALRYAPGEIPHTRRKKHHPIWVVFFGDPSGNRTHVTAGKGPCLNRLTNGPGLTKRTSKPK